jgi:hypothetical protein
VAKHDALSLEDVCIDGSAVLQVALGRIVVSEKEAPNLLANLV